MVILSSRVTATRANFVLENVSALWLSMWGTCMFRSTCKVAKAIYFIHITITHIEFDSDKPYDSDYDVELSYH